MQPFFTWRLFETIWFLTPHPFAKEQRNTSSCQCSEYLRMNKLLLSREYIFMFRIANREVLLTERYCDVSDPSALQKKQCCKFITWRAIEKTLNYFIKRFKTDIILP